MLNSRFSSDPLHAPLTTRDGQFVTASIDCVGLLITGLLHDMRKNHTNPETELYRSLDTATRLLGQAMEAMIENGFTTESPEKSLHTVTEYLKASKGK